MAVASIPVLSKEYVWVPITAAGEDMASLTAMTVEMAFLPSPPETASPGSGDWKAGDWAPETPYDYTGVARCLVGPGSSAALAVGVYYVWVRLTGATERPVRFSGQIKIT